MPQSSGDRLLRSRPRIRHSAKEAAETRQILLVLELEDLQESRRRDEPEKPSLGVDDGDAAAAAAGSRASGCLEVGLR